MKKKIIILFFPLLIASCSNIRNQKSDIIKVILEKDPILYKSNSYMEEIKKGENISFILSIKNDGWIENCSYKDYSLTPVDELQVKLELKNVLYNTYVTLDIAYEKIIYNGNGGLSNNGEEIINYKKYNYHLRENVVNKMDIFYKDGYVPIGFNTSKDGLGEHIGFGSRIPYGTREIFLTWEKETPLEDFIYHKNNDQLVLDSYIGNSKKVVLPISKGTLYLSDYLFKDKSLDTLIISNNVEYLGNKTFSDLKLNELYIADNNANIPGASLDKCNIKKVHINASISPAYSGTYYDSFQDKMDYLCQIKDKKKIVLFGGSSVRYGYNSEAIMKEFPDYNVVNMGVYAYYNAIPQIEIISKFMNEGDILLHSPEFDNHAVKQQFCMTNNFEFEEFAAFESNYELLSLLDLSKYPTFFTSFEEFLKSRLDMEHRDYSFASKHYDDDFTYHAEDVYNIYGDMIMYRKGHDIPNVKIFQDYCDHTIENITPNAISSLNNIYDELKKENINVLFTYYPKNRYCLSQASTLEKRNELENYINDNLHAPVISKMEDYLFDANYFYLIDNHLSTEGAEIRTERIIKDLRKYIF